MATIQTAAVGHAAFNVQVSKQGGPFRDWMTDLPEIQALDVLESDLFAHFLNLTGSSARVVAVIGFTGRQP